MCGAGRFLMTFSAGSASVFAHFFLLYWISSRQKIPQTATEPPYLLVDSVEVFVAETEAFHSYAVPVREKHRTLPPMPGPSPILVDTSHGLDMPLPPQQELPRLPLQPNQSDPPVLPNQAPPSAIVLPEISLPPAQPELSTSSVSTGGATARIEHPRLVTDLSTLRKHYPSEARKQGWQGTVILRLDIAANGTLRNVSLLHSSGHAVLDRAAMRMIRAARFSGGPGTLTQSINYSLK